MFNFVEKNGKYCLEKNGVCILEFQEINGVTKINNAKGVNLISATLSGESETKITINTENIKDGAVTADKLAPGVGGSSTIANNSVTTAKIVNGNVTTAKIADGNVTTAKIADGNVTTAKIADGDVNAVKLDTSSVTTAKIADGNVTTAKIADGNVTNAKINAPTVTVTDDTTYDTVPPGMIFVVDGSSSVVLGTATLSQGKAYLKKTNTAGSALAAVDVVLLN
jgi:hypothetical protein